MRIMIALGGNALLERHDKPDASIQRRHIQAAAAALVPLAAEHDLLICHGNGPQVGLLALESEADTSLSEPYPLDALGAQTQGMIGYWLAQELRNAGVLRPVAALITQTVVAADDPAFAHPTKFVGAVYPHDVAAELAVRHGWTVAPDGPVWRRVVASPSPVRIVEESVISRLIGAGVLVICGGGGGVPVVQETNGTYTGVQAVVDKDLTAASIAGSMGAQRLLLLTDVSAVQRHFGTARAELLRTLDVDEIAGLNLPAGSMLPKAQACARFTSATGYPSAIGALTQASAVLAGTAGTTITDRAARSLSPTG
ncbi:MAG: carbamate kinase [Actinomycetota bacterium]|nr:carbamate kinase [Actinomycetota bacterium]MDQ2957325.1 carbamate kinase [Actinomycetota bacterium]